jgi:hypothetical protein
MIESLTAADVARGSMRLLADMGFSCVPEVTLGNDRRADLLGVDAHGTLALVEIKVSLADLTGDAKWPDYLGYADQFWFAVPAGFPLSPFDRPAFAPETCGLIVADRFSGACVRPAPVRPVAPARRKATTLLLARRAADRLRGLTDAPPVALVT